MRLWITEQPSANLPAADERLLVELGWTDVSWHNDELASFAYPFEDYEYRFRLWIPDYDDPHPMWHITEYSDEDDWLGDVVSENSLKSCLMAFESLLERRS